MFGEELKIISALEIYRTDALNKLFEIITMLGEEVPMVLIIAILYFAFNKNFAQKLFYITITSLGINGIIKNFIKLPRPFAKGKVTCVRPETATGYSFPSGHTQNFSTWSTVVNLKIKKWWSSIIVGIFILLVAFSRVFLGAHFPSDVIVGGILGITIGVIGSIIYDKVEDKRKLYSITALLFTPFAIFFMINVDPLYVDFYKVYGMLIGLVLAVKLEEKYEPLEYNVVWWKKCIRVFVAIIIAFIIKEAIKVLNVFEMVQLSIAFDMIRYMLLIFTVFGICPIIFKKLKL